jgi:hypothetical protein
MPFNSETNNQSRKFAKYLLGKRKAMKNCPASAEHVTTQNLSRNVRQGYQSVQSRVNANSCAFPSISAYPAEIDAFGAPLDNRRIGQKL